MLLRQILTSGTRARFGKLVPVTTTVTLVCRNSGHDHDARMVSRFDDARNGEWKPSQGFQRPLGEAKALVMDTTGDLHLRYKFACGAVITQARLHSLLDEARTNGESSITID